jgi:hypothetical protein
MFRQEDMRLALVIGQTVLVFFVAAVTQTALAQIDPSSALLLNGGSRPLSKDSGLDSGRYTVKPKAESVRRDEPRTSRRSSSQPSSGYPDPGDESIAVVVPSNDPAPQATPSPGDSAAGEAGKASQNQAPNPQAVARPVAVPLGPDPRRVNLVELSLSPTFVYTNSDSGYFFRRYSTSGPGLSVDALVWLTSNFALHTSYLGTLGGFVNDSLDGRKIATASQTWFTAGFRTRKFFGESRASPALSLGVDYLDRDFRVPSDAVYRARLRSSGPVLSLEAEVPSSFAHSWFATIGFAPKIDHKESASTTDFKSGSGVDANQISFAIGARYRFDDENALFWRLSHTIERDLFNGTASGSDPLSGLTPAGVAVTDSLSILQIGYTWGN